MHRFLLAFVLSIFTSAGAQPANEVPSPGPKSLAGSNVFALTFVNPWEDAIGPPRLQEFGRAFLEELETNLRANGVTVKPEYLTSGGRISGRYYMTVRPIPSLNRCSADTLCIESRFYDILDPNWDKPTWRGIIGVPALDLEEVSSPSKGYGRKSASFLARGTHVQLKRLGLYQ